jgi:hypothetical protein
MFFAAQRIDKAGFPHDPSLSGQRPQGNRMNILLPRKAVFRTLFPRGRKSGAFLPVIFPGNVAAERNFHSIALTPSKKV